MDYLSLEKLLDYNSKTGIITWSCNRQGHIKKGDVAGTIQSNRNGKKYRSIKVNGRHYLAHRIAWLLYYKVKPSGCIDHINGNGLDNEISNLRDVSRSENQHNQKLSARSSTGVMGVSKDKKSGKWLVRIGSRKNQKRLGYYSDFFEAVCVRKSAELKLGYHKNHGAFRPL